MVPYAQMTRESKVAHNRALSEKLIFDLGGYLSAANRLGYTDAWLRRKIDDTTIRGSEGLLSLLRGLTSSAEGPVSALYSDNDPFVCRWLSALISAGHLPSGDVLEADISGMGADDLANYRHCHFFAGIGGWPLALEMAGWSATRPVWTGSCPCQPFSAAGKHKGTADERHLWPEFLRLIAECRPPTIFGEQVASRAGREWLAGVRADLEALGYAVGAADLCAASAGAPHIRQRLFWVADAEHAVRGPFGRSEQDVINGRYLRWSQAHGEPGACGEVRGLGDADSQRCDRLDTLLQPRRPQQGRIETPWSSATWLPCLDGKARRIEPGTFPLAHGVPNRVGRLRGYGNAIVPQVAAGFVKAFLDDF